MQHHNSANRKLTGLVLLATLLTSVAATAEVYRWVDDQGVVHYGDRASSGKNAQTVDLRSSGANESAPTPAPSSQSAQPAGAPDPARVAEVRAEQCEKARERLQKFQDAEQILVSEDGGEQRALDADERVQTIVRAETQVARLCEAGPAP